MTIRLLAAALCAAAVLTSSARADGMIRPDSHAPIGVMGEHLHKAGGLMFSFRSAFMDMHGNRDGQSNRSVAEVRSEYPIVPTQMRMAMHMLGMMYAPTDDVTLMVMAPFVRLDMDHITPANSRFTTSASGLGDVTASGQVRLWREGGRQLHANLGVSLPTGSIDQKDRTPPGRARLPYPMQLGSGTWDLDLGLTYTALHQGWSWGAQAGTVLRLGENNNDYKLGNRGRASVWISRTLFEGVSFSLRTSAERWGSVHGADPDLVPGLVPTADPDAQSGTRVDLLAGVNYAFGEGAFAGHRLAVEFGRPVYQSLDGPRLETDWRLIVGWQLAL